MSMVVSKEQIEEALAGGLVTCHLRGITGIEVPADKGLGVDILKRKYAEILKRKSDAGMVASSIPNWPEDDALTPEDERLIRAFIKADELYVSGILKQCTSENT